MRWALSFGAVTKLPVVVGRARGALHSAAVSSDGDVYAWGLESSGQLGLGSARTRAHTPTKVEALSGKGVTQLSCGMYHTLALTAAGEVYSCGFGGSLLNGASGLELHQFKWLDGDHEIGDLPHRWNHLVDYDADRPESEISNLHFTIGGPYFDAYANCSYAPLWRAERDSMLNAEQRMLELPKAG